MLAKQLHDFLHVYRKDTEQIRIESTAQLEAERKKHLNKLIDEKAFQTLLYKCSESELEEIMSIYMKHSQDSSVFLGAIRHAQPASSHTHVHLGASRSSSAVASTSSMSKFETNDEAKVKQIPKSSSVNLKPKPPPPPPSEIQDNQPRSQPKEGRRQKKISSSPTHSPTRVTADKESLKKKNADEYSNVSCDSHSRSIFSNSSDEESDAFTKSSHSRSRSNSSTSSTHKRKKDQTSSTSKRYERINPYLISLPGRRQNRATYSTGTNQKSVASLIKKGRQLSSAKKIRSEINSLREKSANGYSSANGKKDDGGDGEKIVKDVHSKKSNADVNSQVKELRNPSKVYKSNSTTRPSTSLSTVTLARSNSSTGKFYREASKKTGLFFMCMS